MKKINKREPEFFKSYIVKNKPIDWGALSKEIGYDIRDYMLSGSEPDKKNINVNESEQNFQCAYTEIDIEPERNSHIDHFKKQDLFPRLKFDWQNIFACSNISYIGAKHKDNKYKIKREDYELLINPVSDDPNDYFQYAITGEIIIRSNDKNSVNYKKAKTTIDVFNLNDKYLVELRKTVAKQLMDYGNSLSISDLKQNIGKFESFIDYIYNNYMNKT